MVNVCNKIFALINVSAYSRRVNPDTDTHDDTEEEELSDNDLIIKDNLFYEAVRCDVMKWKFSMTNLMQMLCEVHRICKEINLLILISSVVKSVLLFVFCL